MDATQRCVVSLLKSSITGIKEELTEKIELAPLFPLFKRHHISSLIYHGALLCGYDANDPAMQKLFNNYYRIMQRSAGQQSELERVFQAFEKAEIDYMPLKGIILDSYYSKPGLRYMGDADILIRLEQYPQIQQILQNLGFEFKYESDHELVWRSKYLLIELHKQLMPDKNLGFNSYFGDGWSFAKKQSGYRHSMNTEDTYLFLLAHFAKHYQDGGAGCRYVIDLWLYKQRHPEMDIVYLQQELEKLHLTTFVNNLYEMLSVWLEGEPETDLSDVMTRYIFDSGSWGTNESILTAKVLRERNKAPVALNSKFVYICSILFPGRKLLQSKYTILHKAPWLLPVIWIIRPFYKLLFENKSAVNRISQVDEVSDERVRAHYEMLKYVGLDIDI